MSTNYCHQIFPAGLTCRHRHGDICLGFFPICGYKSKTPPSVAHKEAERLYKDYTFKRDMEWIKSGKGLPPLEWSKCGD